MTKTILITGTTHGLGHALALRFAKENYKVYAIGRNQEKLENLAKQSPLIQPVRADVSLQSGLATIYDAVKKESSLSIIHNAAIVKPSLIKALESDSLRQHFETNFFAPIFITQKLLPILNKGSRVIHISSGAADLALGGMMPYCTSKAALERATHCLNLEFNPRGIYFANVRPGMLDTDMQQQLRNCNEADLPDKRFYLDAKKENKLIPPSQAAEFILKIMLKTPNAEFSQTLWNIYDSMSYKFEFSQPN